MSTQYHDLLDQAMRRYYVDTLGLSERQLRASSETRHEMNRGQRLAKLLEQEVGISGKLVLDVGSGWGEVIYKCYHLGARAFGVEPYIDDLQVSDALLNNSKSNRHLINGVGEELPFPSDFFDVVICNHVLEHVQAPALVIEEILRVVRPGGKVLLAFPNYLIPFEGHYHLMWIPFMPKWLGRLYLQIMRRNPAYFQHYINYVTFHNVQKILQKYPVSLRCLTEERIVRSIEAKWGIERVIYLLQVYLKLYKTVTFLIEKH